ncbi:acetyl-CoA carboxylase biotin carboxylase subunit [Bacillus aerius]|uniref:acetyl-CoA carboxylase biotin carboxylase subunit n=1 Tax=Bacillus aerius TaxID=293388 RepID=UPI002815A826|nr:acetyl-CoA carboxylase biotin carboxylase subunit [Bacillus aerius]WMT27616.1 acetyl-CoA carboxylase biotin carboxylase subunit [Bacillus aerius]
MFEQVLIANRGEIARRVIRTCKRLGIKTVAVYSEADQHALHVQEADSAYYIGSAKVSESYLNMEAIIKVAKQTNADAIHPGYGLLSESAVFAERCRSEGIAFIGPSAQVIQQMGNKIEARKTMEQAGIPIVPGVSAPLHDADEGVHKAQTLGYPIMLKASSGGGGIGMQLVRNDEELHRAFEGNQKRAQNFFQDGTLYMEKVIEHARHIEIQVLFDSFGHGVHLFERDCSLQRRHQKIVEEAPAVCLEETVRQQMGQMAVKAAKAIGYENAGTIECLVDQNQQFYFLEMNTRLQVEHPVTEEITGIDLVEEQLKIAALEPLSFSQEDIHQIGHAIEVRIYAEDPVTFYPSPGTITRLSTPDAPYIRHESSVTSGSVITPFYDPMIAKMIVYGDTRKLAIERLKAALQAYEIEGIKTNVPFLKEMTESTAFLHGRITTDYLMKKREENRS